MQQRRFRGGDPSRRLAGWTVVVLVHAAVIWALVSGTARQAVQAVRKPMEAALLQEVIIPPPPPPPAAPPREIRKPPPKVARVPAPPPPFVPPPEVQPPVSSGVAVPSVPKPPVTPPVIEAPPPAPPAPVPAPAPKRSAPAEIAVACPQQVRPEMPRKALQDGVEGVVRAQALIRDGAVREVTILSGPRVFHAAVRGAMLQYKCITGSDDVLATQEFVFKIEQ